MFKTVKTNLILGLLLACFGSAYYWPILAAQLIPVRTKIIQSTICFLFAAWFLLRALYLWMLDSPKGRSILRKIPLQWLQRKVTEYE